MIVCVDVGVSANVWGSVQYSRKSWAMEMVRDLRYQPTFCSLKGSSEPSRFFTNTMPSSMDDLPSGSATRLSSSWQPEPSLSVWSVSSSTAPVPSPDRLLSPETRVAFTRHPWNSPTPSTSLRFLVTSSLLMARVDDPPRVPRNGTLTELMGRARNRIAIASDAATRAPLPPPFDIVGWFDLAAFGRANVPTISIDFVQASSYYSVIT